MGSEHTNNDDEVKEELTDEQVQGSAANVNGEEKVGEPTDEQGDANGADEPDAQLSEIEELNRKLGSISQQAQENLELAMRTQAEIDNLRKRTIRDIENAHKYALEKIVGELLPIIDSIELGIQASVSGETDAVSGIREGLDLTMKKFNDTLHKFGVEVINPEGEKFTPEKHEAVSMQVSEEAEQGRVISVLQKGYKLNGRLVRPAMVIVSK